MKNKHSRKNAWRSVDLPYDVLGTNEEFQYLADFEELDTYEVLETEKPKVSTVVLYLFHH